MDEKEGETHGTRMTATGANHAADMKIVASADLKKDVASGNEGIQTSGCCEGQQPKFSDDDLIGKEPNHADTSANVLHAPSP